MCGKSCELTEEKLPNVVQRAGDEVRRWSRCRSRSWSCGDIKGSVCCILRENTHNTHDKDNKRQLRFHCYAKCLHEFPLQFPNAQIARSWALSCFQCRMICPTRHLLRRILFAGLINWTCEREHAERNKKSLWANVTFFCCSTTCEKQPATPTTWTQLSNFSCNRLMVGSCLRRASESWASK